MYLGTSHKLSIILLYFSRPGSVQHGTYIVDMQGSTYFSTYFSLGNYYVPRVKLSIGASSKFNYKEMCSVRRGVDVMWLVWGRCVGHKLQI